MATQVQTAVVSAIHHLQGVEDGAQDPTPHDVEADIVYFRDAEDGSVASIADIASNDPKFCDPRRVLMRDIRGQETDFTLEKQGFQLVERQVPEDECSSEEKIKTVHYREMENFVKDFLGAKQVLMYHHLVRNAPWANEYNNTESNKGPAKRPHLDASKNWAREIVKGQLYLTKQQDQIPSVMAGHWQLINIWRPLKTVQKHPLAVADSTTVPWSDQHLLSYKRPTPVGEMTVENCFTKASKTDEHKWYYLNQQRPNEVLLFKIYDSDQSAKTGGVTHTSFMDPATEQMPTRESIEMRCIVAY